MGFFSKLEKIQTIKKYDSIKFYNQKGTQSPPVPLICMAMLDPGRREDLLEEKFFHPYLSITF